MYSVSDLVIRIKNGYMAGIPAIESPHSKSREEILKKLVKLGFVKSYKIKGEIKKSFTIELVYKEKTPALTDVKVFSTPGRRWYVAANELRPVQGGMGYAIISTSQGLMTNVEAKKKKTGGELLFHIW